MNKLWKRMVMAVFCALSGWVLQAAATEQTAGAVKEVDERYLRYYTSYHVNDDLTFVTRNEVAVRIEHERALEEMKEYTISYSTSIEKARVIEAYTLKPDGRRIDAPKDNFQLFTNTGNEKNAPVFSDRSRLTVVFPAVEVGDTVVFIYELTQSEPMFPGEFAVRDSFSSDMAFDDVKVILDVPKALKGKYRINGMKEKIAKKGGRTIYEWSYSNPTPASDNGIYHSIWNGDAENGYAYSSFDSYEEIAKSYGVRAIPKAAVTGEIDRLAAKIVGDEKQPFEKAHLLYDWVVHNITYGGNCIGVGAVVPHDLSFILQNRMGDCKDHATILQALLAAEDIKSTQALINAGSSYDLPEIPYPFSVNHVINYLPDFNLFVDATAHSVPFGLLPYNLYSKPVLLVQGYQKGMKIPATRFEDMSHEFTTTVKIAEDGSVTGDIDVKVNGLMAVSARAGWRNMTRDMEENYLKKIFSNHGKEGFAVMHKDDPQPLLSSFNYRVEFSKNSELQRPGAGAFYVFPLYPVQATIASVVSGYENEIDDQPQVCGNGAFREKYIYIFPAGMKVLAKPEDMKISGADIRYEASYQMENNRLTVTRLYEDRTKGNVCQPELIKAQRDIALQVKKNLLQQVVYQ